MESRIPAELDRVPEQEMAPRLVRAPKMLELGGNLPAKPRVFRNNPWGTVSQKIWQAW